jgi:peptidoglycan hydrolase-like protein with peptidoglycan-binding domain
MASSTSSRKGAGDILKWILAIACIALIIACYSIYSNAQTRVKDAQDKAAQDVKAVQDKAAQDVATARNDVQRMATERDAARRVLSNLPPALRGSSDAETTQRIQKLFDDYTALSAAPARPAPGGASASASGSTPGAPAAGAITAPAQDTPGAWLENISRQVMKASIDTKAPTGNDPAKVAVHRGVQMVLARIGAFGKPPTGNPEDTYAAVVAFQKANGLTADGKIGKGTWGKVREKYESLPRAQQ